ncbi:MAG: glycerophosphodiester phosphodiesterase [Psychromonas sp.]
MLIKRTVVKYWILVMCAYLVVVNSAVASKVVIAHRGASGYLPEHSMEAKAMAYAMGADFIEQDVVMTKDDQLVVIHDHYLDRVTNVAEQYPGRQREDGRFYAIDFTLAEIKTLEMLEAFRVEAGRQVAIYPQRFPLGLSNFRVHTLQDEIEMIQGLNQSTGKQVGLYVEIKAPWFHRHEGKDISLKVLNVLKKYGYVSHRDAVYVQSFDANELKRIDQVLLKQLSMDLKLVQLIANTDWGITKEYREGKVENYSYDWMFSEQGMVDIAQYAEAIGPWYPMLVSPESVKENLIISGLVKQAHQAGLIVHPYTFRADQGKIPAYANNFEQLLTIFYYQVGVDGVFTDFPDRAVTFLKNHVQ